MALSTKARYVADGVFKAELNALLTREFVDLGYGGCEVRDAPDRREIIILLAKAPMYQRIRELKSLLRKRFRMTGRTLEVYYEKVNSRFLSAVYQCEALRYQLIERRIPLRESCILVAQSIMRAGARGCEITVSGKLRDARAKSFKLVEGTMLHSGGAVDDFVDSAVRHVSLAIGALGIKVKVMHHDSLSESSQHPLSPQPPPGKVIVKDTRRDIWMEHLPLNLWVKLIRRKINYLNHKTRECNYPHSVNFKSNYAVPLFRRTKKKFRK